MAITREQAEVLRSNPRLNELDKRDLREYDAEVSRRQDRTPKLRYTKPERGVRPGVVLHGERKVAEMWAYDVEIGVEYTFEAPNDFSYRTVREALAEIDRQYTIAWRAGR